ncbi:alanyl-tRNA editing protein [Fusibacter sp. JL298sf-3]
MTNRKYLENPYRYTFDACVQSIREDGGIVLDATYFYPEGGGQPYDIGCIGEVDVTAVHLEEGAVVHYTSAPVPVGTLVHCTVDAKRRFGHMQQHSGQHLISAIAYKHFNANTVGLHISDTYTTVDFDVKLSADAVAELVRQTQQAIVDGADIKSHWAEPATLNQYPLRKQPKVQTGIRIIEIESYDFSPCGGTHVQNTREIGGILLKKAEAYKSGVRLTLLFGLYEHALLSKYTRIFDTLAGEHAIAPDDVCAHVEHLTHRLNDLQKAYDHLMQTHIEQACEVYATSDETLVILRDETLPMQWLRTKVQLLTNKRPCVVLAHAVEGTKQHVVIGKSQGIAPDIHLGNLFKSELTAAGVKGGGNAYMAQGGCAAEVALGGTLSKFAKQLEDLIDG